MTRVIGLDLSLTATGVADAEGHTQRIRCGDLRGTDRLAWICSAISGHVQAGADLVVIEGPAYSRALGAGHHEAAGLWWLIAYHLDGLGVPRATVPPNVLKKYATGSGQATKADMRVELYKRTGLDLRDDNEVDAWWLRAAGLDRSGAPPVKMPAAHREALTNAEWPGVIA